VRPEAIAGAVREALAGLGDDGTLAARALGVPAHVEPGARVVAAMSGGVDSSVAAALLKAAGLEVIGVSMRLGSSATRADGHTGCCSLDDFADARRTAELLAIPHYVIDLRASFQASVIDTFTATYLEGRTPNPCVVCNRDIKFDALWDYAATIGARAIGTGHYARIGGNRAAGLFLRSARDRTKDQSYFLFTLDRAQLGRTLFPVGCLEKRAVRVLACALGLPVADKPESQDICFVAGQSYVEFVERRAPAASFRPGTIVDTSGRVLGQHDGVHRFTVGQRRGVGGGAPGPRYVTSIDPASGEVRVGSRAELATLGFVARDVRWSGAPHHGAASVRLRHRHAPVRCFVTPEAGDARVRFEQPTIGVTPGQAAVWYDGERVLGGGWIEARL